MYLEALLSDLEFSKYSQPNFPNGKHGNFAPTLFLPPLFDKTHPQPLLSSSCTLDFSLKLGCLELPRLNTSVKTKVDDLKGHFLC